MKDGMRCRIADYPTRGYVQSESEEGVEYLVDLTRFTVGWMEDGTPIYNGSCGRSDLGAIGCKDFIYRCEPMLKKPENAGKCYRCKHLRFFREHAIDFLLPKMQEMDPNHDESLQT